MRRVNPKTWLRMAWANPDHQDPMVYAQRMRNVLRHYPRQRAVRPRIRIGLHHTRLWNEPLVWWEMDHKDDPEYMNEKFDLFAAAFNVWQSWNGTFVPKSMKETGGPRGTSRSAWRITSKPSPSAPTLVTKSFDGFAWEASQHTCSSKNFLTYEKYSYEIIMRFSL